MSGNVTAFPGGGLAAIPSDPDAVGDNVVNLECVTSLDLPVERILNGAISAELTSVLVIGLCEDGTEYFAASMASGPENLWMLERAKKALLAIGD